MERAGIAEADLALLFATAKHDPARMLRSVRAAVGSRARIVGGGTAGIITNDRLGYEGCQAGVAVLRSETVRVDTFLQPALDRGEKAAGYALAEQLLAASITGPAATLLMYEAVKRATLDGPMLNMGTPLLEGLAPALDRGQDAVGFGFLGGPRWMPGAQYFDDRLETQSVLAVVLSGGVRMSTVVMNSVRPMSTYREITATDGPAVLGIDGRPALEVIEDLVGPDLRWEDYPLTVTLGVNSSADKFGDVDDSEYASFLCVAVDRERRALIMSDTYLQPGTQVQLMRRHMDFREIRERADRLLACVPGRAFLALYIDCAGRASAYVGSDREEAEEIQAAVGNALPLLGVYSGSELARVGGSMRRMNHAGVLTVLSE